MKLWHSILLAVGTLMLVGGILTLVIDNPQYATGEAIAMVERVYHWHDNSADCYTPLNEEYLGRGIWEVKSLGVYRDFGYRDRAIFRVYEVTDTVEIYNDVARIMLDRREKLEELEEREEPEPTPSSKNIPWPWEGGSIWGEEGNPFK